MSIFERAVQSVEDNREKEFNCIPFPFPKFSKFLPGIIQNRYYCVTAQSGIGKSKLTDFMFLYGPYDFLNNTETDIKLKIFYFSLEVDKQTKILSGVSRWLYVNYGIEVDVDTLKGYRKDKVSSEVLGLIKKGREYFEKFEDICEFNDDSINPYGIFKRVDDYCKASGKIYRKKLDIVEDGISKTIEAFDYYKPNNPNEYIMIVTDHISLLTNENGMNKYENLEKHSNNVVKLKNKYGIIGVDIQQQAVADEQLQFNYKGESIQQKLEPSLANLGDCKLTARNHEFTLGLFAPSRYDIKTYRGHDVTKYGNDGFRSLSILKNRYGVSGVNVGLEFKGNVDYFKEI